MDRPWTVPKTYADSYGPQFTVRMRRVIRSFVVCPCNIIEFCRTYLRVTHTFSGYSSWPESYILHMLKDTFSYDHIIWATLSEKVPSSMRKMCGLTSSCACPRLHPGICSPLKHSIVHVSSDSVCGQRKPWSDCASAQSDQGLRYLNARRHVFSRPKF